MFSAQLRLISLTVLVASLPFAKCQDPVYITQPNQATVWQRSQQEEVSWVTSSGEYFSSPATLYLGYVDPSTGQFIWEWTLATNVDVPAGSVTITVPSDVPANPTVNFQVNLMSQLDEFDATSDYFQIS